MLTPAKTEVGKLYLNYTFRSTGNSRSACFNVHDDVSNTQLTIKMTKEFTFQDIKVPSPGFGAMGLSFGLGSDLSLEQAEPVLLKAIELGCTFWDTAVVYQAGVNEKLLGDFIRKHNVRDKVFSTAT